MLTRPRSLQPRGRWVQACGQLRALQLTDIHDGRLHLGDRAILLAGPVRARLASYLDHRQHAWPHTANPHLFITQQTALRDMPASDRWIRLKLGMHSFTDLKAPKRPVVGKGATTRHHL